MLYQDKLWGHTSQSLRMWFVLQLTDAGWWSAWGRCRSCSDGKSWKSGFLQLWGHRRPGTVRGQVQADWLVSLIVAFFMDQAWPVFCYSSLLHYVEQLSCMKFLVWSFPAQIFNHPVSWDCRSHLDQWWNVLTTGWTSWERPTWSLRVDGEESVPLKCLNAEWKTNKDEDLYPPDF